MIIRAARSPWFLVRMVRGIGKAAAMLALWTASTLYAHAEEDTEQRCFPVSDLPSAAPPPAIFLGMSFDFEEGVVAAFPVGSPESRLLQWLDRRGFYGFSYGTLDTAFVDEPEELSRSLARMRSGQKIHLRTLRAWAPIGHSYFSVAWNADGCGRLTEIFADTEIFQFDMP